MRGHKRYAIITPYHKEARHFLLRAINSVKNQTVPTDHFLIADGFAQEWIDKEDVRHIRLDREHGYGGNTPRGVGALIAIGEEYDGIGMLDADNWLDNDHVQTCIEAAESCDGGPLYCDYVIAQWRLRRPDETIMPWPEEHGHVDTCRFFFLKGAFSVIPHWAMMPPQLAPICDRVFYAMLRRQPFQFVRVKRPTVNYHCLWEVCYRVLGERPPEGAKPSNDTVTFDNYLASISARELEVVTRLTGVNFMAKRPEPAPSRNSPCPCGSGKKFKNCHGAWTA
jgi:glycosyltransferase involved in cell wall biosynthesis